MLFFSLYQYLKYSHYSSYQIDESKITDSSFFGFYIETFESKYDVLQVRGWIAYKGENIRTWKSSLLIQNDDSCYIVPMTLQKRTDVTETLNDGFNYDNSGFSVTVNRSYIESDNARYYILYENNGRDMIVDINGVIGGK